jgi:hypothetical protein
MLCVLLNKLNDTSLTLSYHKIINIRFQTSVSLTTTLALLSAMKCIPFSCILREFFGHGGHEVHSLEFY